jgi:hypothetical protein
VQIPGFDPPHHKNKIKNAKAQLADGTCLLTAALGEGGRQKDHEFEVSVGYTAKTLSQKKKKKKKQGQKS